jgi:hypothetical protein
MTTGPAEVKPNAATGDQAMAGAPQGRQPAAPPRSGPFGARLVRFASNPTWLGFVRIRGGLGLQARARGGRPTSMPHSHKTGFARTHGAGSQGLLALLDDMGLLWHHRDRHGH